jgi:hypothetical protein
MPRAPTMPAISSGQPTTVRQGREIPQMAIHQIPTNKTPPTLGAAGTSPNHRILAMTPTAPSDTTPHFPVSTMIRQEAAHPHTSYPLLHLTGRPNLSQHHHEIKREASSIIPAPRDLKLPSMLEGICPSPAQPKPRDGCSPHTLSHRHESVIQALSMAHQSTGRTPTSSA